MDEELYSQNILELYRHPHNKGVMKGATMSGEGINASCGDRVSFFMKVNGDKVMESSFDGEGCAISLAAASMLTDKVNGMSMNQLRAITPGDIYNMLGIKISPARVNCALLGYEALEQALKKNV